MSELKVMSLIATFDFYFQKSQTRIFRGFYYPPIYLTGHLTV
jgi:hypothetical protein